MKKLFVLFLLVALVPFTVGCSLFGSSYDDPDPVPTSRLAISKVIPAAGILAGNIRAAAVALNVSDLFMEVVYLGVTYKLPYKSHTVNADGNVVVVFETTLPTATFDTLKGKATTAEIKVQPAGVASAVTVVAATAYTVPSNIVSGTTTADTTVQVSKTLAEIEAALKLLDSTITIAQYKVSTVKLTKRGATAVTAEEIGTSTSNITDIASAASYTFEITMDAAYTNTSAPTFEVSAQNTRTGTTAKSIATSGTTSPIAVTWNEAKTVATIVITPNSTYELKVGETYKVGAITNAEATVGTTTKVKATTPAARFIRIVQ